MRSSKAWSEPPWEALFAILASIALHLLTYGALRFVSQMPSVDFELQHPSVVEFGLTDPKLIEPPPAQAAVVPEPEPAGASEPTAAAEKPKKKKPKAKLDAGLDGAVAEQAPDAGAPSALAADAGPAPDEEPGQGKALLAQYAPEGAQIALRIHMGRVRESELAEDVRRLLDAVPDWHLLLDGSELDPLRDLERLYLATPDLRRSHLVVAGEYVGTVAVPELAVKKLAEARGVKARWRRHGTIRVAPWANADETARVLALIAPQQFAITRPQDLPRVLAVARALAARQDEVPSKPDGGQSSTDALLGLAEDQTLGVAVEGARLFVRGEARGVPERFDVTVRRRQDGVYEARLLGTFESEQAAETASKYWTRQRDRFAAHPLIALIGLRQPLANAELSAKSAELEVLTTVTAQQARLVLGFLRDALIPGAPRTVPDPPARPSSP